MIKYPDGTTVPYFTSEQTRRQLEIARLNHGDLAIIFSQRAVSFKSAALIHFLPLDTIRWCWE